MVCGLGMITFCSDIHILVRSKSKCVILFHILMVSQFWSQFFTIWEYVEIQEPFSFETLFFLFLFFLIFYVHFQSVSDYFSSLLLRLLSYLV